MEMYDDIFEVATATRVILVVAILNSQSADIIYDENFCFFSSPKQIPYRIVFKKVNIRDDSQLTAFNTAFQNMDDDLVSIVNTPSNRMLIFLDGSTDIEEERNSLREMSFLYNIIQDTPIRKTLYCKLKWASVMTTVYPNIYRIYNLKFYQPFGKNSEIKNLLFLSVPPPQNNRLSCQPWFDVFLNTVNKCGYRRLIQLSSTCYLNVIINAFVLSKRLKKIAIRYMNAFLRRRPETEAYIKTMLTNVIPCADVYGDDSIVIAQFFFRFIYNLCCKRDDIYKSVEKTSDFGIYRIYKSREDVLEAAHYELFGDMRKLRYTRSSQKLKKQKGGRIFESFKRILKACSIPSMSSVEVKSTGSLDFQDINGLNPETDAVEIYPDIILHIGTFFADLYREQNYSLEGCIILFQHPQGNHVISGFFCEGIPKIFDSNGVIFEYDWTNMNTMEFFSIPYFLMYGNKPEDFTNFKILYIFANNNIDSQHVSCP